jgi:hypothetical protein
VSGSPGSDDPDKDNEFDLLGHARQIRPALRGRAAQPPSRVKATSLSLAERIRSARGIPQAVAKITRFQRTASQCRRHWSYISRRGTLELETEDGDLLRGLGEQREVLKAWELSFDDHRNSRNQMNYTVSAPKESSPEAVREAAREFGKAAFAGHRYVFTLHTDKAHPHVHFAVHMRGPTKKLNPRLKDLHRWRELWAEKARAQGIEMACSPRAARGEGRRARRFPIEQMQRRGITPKVTTLAVKDAVATDIETPWEQHARARNHAERQAYRQSANDLRAAAEARPAEEQRKLNAAATELEQFAARMPAAKTRRQRLREALAKHLKQKSPGRESDDLER